jgi:hypothetical protein
LGQSSAAKLAKASGQAFFSPQLQQPDLLKSAILFTSSEIFFPGGFN